MLIMLVTLFCLITFYGKYKFVTYSYDVFKNPALEDSVYFMSNFRNDAPVTEEEFLSEVKGFTATNNIIIEESLTVDFKDYWTKLLFYDDNFIKIFEQNLKKGEWLHTSDELTDTEYIEGIVVHNKMKKDVEIGDIISLKTNDQELKVKVIGITGDVTFLPYFGHSGTGVTTDDFFNFFNEIILLNKNCISEEQYEDCKNNDFNVFNDLSNFILSIKKDATESEKSQILDYLSQYGSYVTYDEIMEDTNDQISKQIKEMFPLPIFLLLVSTISMISVSAAAIHRSMREHSVYYLIGCSKRRSIATIITTLLIIFCIPTLINLILAIFFPNFLRTANIYYIDYIINISCTVPVIIYLIIIAAILTFMPIAFYSKHSPLSFYRRNL